MTGYKIVGWIFGVVWVVSFFSGMSGDNAVGLLLITLFWLLWGPIRTYVLGEDNYKVHGAKKPSGDEVWDDDSKYLSYSEWLSVGGPGPRGGWMNMTTGGTNYSGGIHGVCKSSWRFEYLSDYEGSFENMTFDGRGTETWPEGDKYVGEFLDGWYHGQGTYTRRNGEQYVGEWKKGQTNGHGIFTRPNGDRFVGEFKGNELGAGTFYSKDGKRISGWGDLGDPESDSSERPEAEVSPEKSNSQPNKSSSEDHFGTYVSSSGMDYTGDLKRGVAHGQGMARFPNGDKYVGEWWNGKRHGKGVLTLSSGLKLSGEFRLDEYVSLGSERD